MEESESPRALMKRKAWAQSRDSWQASGSQDPGAERREDGGSSDRSKPNTIENWLSGCRTPLRASLDEQSSSSSKGLIKSGSSFEDDLSLGAEANHLPTSTSRSESSSYHTAAQAKRSQYKQKGKSMNSTGSAKSNTTVSSVSELLDLYEEDPEEVLYNLGFGTEEPDIASKIPSRFFNYPSGAHGIDIKVYLAAQIQRMELENPNYALTSRFRQTEVLATVANVFSEIYSHVSGRPMEKIGNGEAESNTQPPLKKNSSALNVARILRRNITKQNLLASGSEGGTKQTDAARTEAESGQNALTDAVQKAPQKQSKKKDSPLATVTEEGQQGPSEATLDGHVTRPLTPDLVVVNGDRSETSDPDSLIHVSVSCASDESDFTKESTLDVDERRAAATSTPDKEPSSLLPNPHVAHLLNQPRDSFEMEELQSNEDELVAAGAGRDPLLRTASQQSDSSGFAEDPSTDGSANHLKVQESYDSCDSETTVTSHAGDGSTPVSLDYPNFERLQGDEAHLQPGRGRLKSTKACEPPNTDATQHSNPFQSTTDSPHASTFGFVEPTTDPSSDTTDETKTITSDSDSIELGNINPEPSDSTFSLSAIHKKRLSLQQKSLSVDEVRPGRVWVRNGDLLRNTSERNPLRRSSSLPTSPPSPARVVTSMRIQLGRGSVKHCTPASYSYRYENEDGDEGDSIPEEEDVDGFRKQHMNVPRYRTHSSNSLYSAPADWPQRPLNEAPPWSTCSVPNLPHFTSHAHHSPPFPPHFYSPQHRVMDSRFTAVYPPPLQTTFTPPPGPHFCHPAHAAGPSYSPAPLHQHPYNLRDNPYAPHPSYSPALASHHPDASYCPPWYPTLYQMPPGAAGSAEMQLRSVLHDIRGTMQTISQGCAVPGEDVERMGTPRSVQTLYEELQLRRRSLNVFRTQMMDLELALMRQQSMVFQHLSLDDRQEAEQLQTLRTSVRHELQELELRLEERLIGLNQQMRSSIFYRHHMGFATGHRLDNLSSSSALQAMEPVTELLKEQLYLQSELGYTSALSSRASSPSRFHESPSPSPQKAGLYRSTLNLTPSAPSRPGPEAPPPAVGSPGRSLADDELSLDDGSRETEDSSLAEWKKSGGLQDLIKEIKESLARDIRQEIVNELLAAVSPGPGRNPV